MACCALGIDTRSVFLELSEQGRTENNLSEKWAEAGPNQKLGDWYKFNDKCSMDYKQKSDIIYFNLHYFKHSFGLM